MKTGGFRTPEAHGKFPEPQGGGFSYLLGKILDWDWDRKEYGHGGSLKFPGFGVMGVMGVSNGPFAKVFGHLAAGPWGAE